jgi:hypothetical protein
MVVGVIIFSFLKVKYTLVKQIFLLSLYRSVIVIFLS